MHWKRGILLAAIHLAVAVPLIVSYERKVWPYLHTNPEPPQVVMRDLAEDQGGQTVTFSRCEGWIHYPPSQTIVMMANFPAIAFSGWGLECPPSWSVAGRLHNDWPTRTRQTEKKTALGLILLIPIEWFLLGSFSIFRQKYWRYEPCIVIAGCTVLSGLLYMIPGIGDGSAAPAVFTGLAWYLWFFALLFFGCRRCWQFLARRLRPTQ
jgi:hypothetical protein